MSAPDPATRLLEHVADLLAARGVDTAWGDDGLLEIAGEPAVGPCVGYVGVEAIETGEAVDTAEAFLLLQAVWPLPIEAPGPSRRRATADLLVAIAPDLALGQLEIDPDTDAVRYRVALLLPTGLRPSDGWLLAPLLEGLNLVDAYTPLFTRVIVDGEAAGHVYAEHRLADARAADLSLDVGERERLVRHLEDAADQYRRAGDGARLDGLAGLVRQVAAG